MTQSTSEDDRPFNETTLRFYLRVAREPALWPEFAKEAHTLPPGARVMCKRIVQKYLEMWPPHPAWNPIQQTPIPSNAEPTGVSR